MQNNALFSLKAVSVLVLLINMEIAPKLVAALIVIVLFLISNIVRLREYILLINMEMAPKSVAGYKKEADCLAKIMQKKNINIKI